MEEIINTLRETHKNTEDKYEKAFIGAMIDEASKQKSNIFSFDAWLEKRHYQAIVMMRDNGLNYEYGQVVERLSREFLNHLHKNY